MSRSPLLMDAVRAHLNDHTKPGRDALLLPADLSGHLHESVSTATGTRPGRPPGAPTCASTTSVTPEQPLPPRPAQRPLTAARLGNTTADPAMIYQHAARAATGFSRSSFRGSRRSDQGARVCRESVGRREPSDRAAGIIAHVAT